MNRVRRVHKKDPWDESLVIPMQRLNGAVVGVELHRSMAARIAELEEWIGAGADGYARPLLMLNTGTRDMAMAKMVRDKVVTGGKVLWVVADGGSTLRMVIDATKEFTEYEHSPSIWSRTAPEAKVRVMAARLGGTPRDMNWNIMPRSDVITHVSGGMVMFWAFSGVDDRSRAKEQLCGVKWELMVVPGT